MEVKTYRASSMQEALALVRAELGADAAVLHTREVQTSRWFGLLSGPRQIEVTASCDVNIPSRRPRRAKPSDEIVVRDEFVAAPPTAEPVRQPPREPQREPQREPIRDREPMQQQIDDLQAMVRELCRRSDNGSRRDLPDPLFRLYTDLIDAEFSEELARELVEQLRGDVTGTSDPLLVRARLARMIEAEVPVAGPIRIVPGTRRLVALVGPTGVGKTTTIAKLAANYRLRERRRVGLITVDTYRIAAVEQLRTYADIIDLPMQVVSSPREMREAAKRMDDLDLVLLDTAGRSPKDEVKIRELRSFLTEAGADEVHLVLSSVAGQRTLEQTAERFAAVGATSLILTKLDEASGLGNLLPLLRRCKLPLSYLTNGQNVPDDIETAEPRRLAQLMLGEEPAADRSFEAVL